MTHHRYRRPGPWVESEKTRAYRWDRHTRRRRDHCHGCRQKPHLPLHTPHAETDDAKGSSMTDPRMVDVSHHDRKYHGNPQ